MANTVWAFATAGVAARTLFEAIATEALRRINEFNSQNMANTVWAFACVGWDSRELFIAFGSAIVERLGEFTEVEQSQLYVVALYVRIKWPNVDFPLARHRESLRYAYTQQESAP
eukprot:CAMPEP_0118890582 /NCGR_PEP_ID=MMETSP1166-20130328/977_1 /TAXON_ID=1104430 /ORGANISM="Chrysoreinhardia sp, Strain CCMP3193" /LENGTH=114 /DNA_ID=CAMNT_0006829199 /DNA_START=222 /DNA_END=563 /DNA_ORIENTATION=+